ncbi:short-subunit dehydrogenase [Stackebrandtia endophytica]|uniref:Short-subunit dehydrogenase n=1 Tax=Stackebrandtia endophytica TaxID=1496996 RepID=A0A543AYK3_9ACTN|nr:SDR family NAD(P)-dependent oxidoreductase [Stackebrandtia endophytica]TQL77651.1 short-subunit dehydrogenase [Stackebrandtia endophytica]
MTKIALITGANRGIGYEIARGLAERGVTVLVGSRTLARGAAAAERLRVATGGKVDGVRLDVTDEASIAEAVRYVETTYGRLDILVNSAGIAKFEGRGNTTDATASVAREVFDTNVFGVISVVNAMADLLRAAPAARIVNVSSEIGSMTYMSNPSNPFWAMQGASYGASKAALNALTVSYAREFWDTPIKVNAITPGYCETDFGAPEVTEDSAVGSRAEAPEGKRTAAAGAAIAVKLALIDADGPTAGFFSDDRAHPAGIVPW